MTNTGPHRSGHHSPGFTVTNGATGHGMTGLDAHDTGRAEMSTV